MHHKIVSRTCNRCTANTNIRHCGDSLHPTFVQRLESLKVRLPLDKVAWNWKMEESG